MIALLTAQEENTIRLQAQGLGLREVAHLMGISPQTVKNHVSSVHQKLDVTNAIGAMNVLGWVVIPGEPRESAYEQCDFIGQCGRRRGHRGHHGGFRPPAK